MKVFEGYVNKLFYRNAIRVLEDKDMAMLC